MTSPEQTALDREVSEQHVAVVAVVVVTYRPDLTALARCVASIAASSVAADLVVVDNGSGPVVEEIARIVAGHGRLVRSSGNRGFAAAVNVGLSSVESELVMLLNDDAALRPDALERAVAQLSAQPAEVAGVAPKVVLATQLDVIDSVGVVLRANGEGFNRAIGEPDVGQFASGDRCLGPCFSAALIRRRAFAEDEVGLLDERYFLYYEDIDWIVRANVRGWRFVVEPAAVVEHGHATSTRRLGLDRRYRLVERNLLVQATSNLTARSAARIWARRLIDHAIGVVRGPYRWARVGAVGQALVGLPASWRARRRLAGPRRASDEELFSFASGEVPRFDSETFTAPRSLDALAAAYRRKHAAFGDDRSAAIANAVERAGAQLDREALAGLLADEPEAAQRYVSALDEARSAER
jgi:GT2 family glycosyltransferase